MAALVRVRRQLNDSRPATMTEQPSDGPVGFLGLGVMGGPMAARLHAAGVNLTAWNRTAVRADAFAAESASVQVADSPAAVAGACRVLISCLLDDAVIEAVHGGPDGTLAQASPGTIVVEHGTFSPDLARRLAARAADHGCTFLDAPVTGGAVGSAAGTLTTMVGGDPAALDAVRPVLAHYTRLIEHVGPPGSGVALKLINQMLVAIHSVATVEAAGVITALGIPHDVAERVLTSGWAASAMLARNLGASLRDEPLDEGAEIRHLALALQVLHPIIGRNDVDVVLEPVVLQRFEDAMRQGLGTTDISGMGRALDPGDHHQR